MPDEKELFSTLHIQIHSCNPGLRDLQGVRYSQYKRWIYNLSATALRQPK